MNTRPSSFLPGFRFPLSHGSNLLLNFIKRFTVSETGASTTAISPQLMILSESDFVNSLL
ncbi:MAG: hypothetical protein IPI04_03140 [Ignavibacteria bacterium]|nr:hypothetical protein [Ignavibacteria bacterium]